MSNVENGRLLDAMRQESAAHLKAKRNGQTVQRQEPLPEDLDAMERVGVPATIPNTGAGTQSSTDSLGMLWDDLVESFEKNTRRFAKAAPWIREPGAGAFMVAIWSLSGATDREAMKGIMHVRVTGDFPKPEDFLVPTMNRDFRQVQRAVEAHRSNPNGSGVMEARAEMSPVGLRALSAMGGHHGVATMAPEWMRKDFTREWSLALADAMADEASRRKTTEL